MGNFNRFDRGGRGGGGGGGGFDRGRSKFGGDRNDGPKQMFPAICSDCGDNCEVPFRPSADHPVYCRDCFKNQGGDSPRFAPKRFDSAPRRTERPSFHGGNESGVSKAQIDALNMKLDKIITLLTPAKAPIAFDTDMVVEKKAKKTPKKVAKKSEEVPVKKAKKVAKKK